MAAEWPQIFLPPKMYKTVLATAREHNVEIVQRFGAKKREEKGRKNMATRATQQKKFEHKKRTVLAPKRRSKTTTTTTNEKARIELFLRPFGKSSVRTFLEHFLGHCLRGHISDVAADFWRQKYLP